MLPLLFLLVLTGPAGDPPAAGPPALNVPYLSQTEALCGGAAAAMIFRFWGDRRAGVQQFEPLVDRRSGGIADTVLVEAIRTAGWDASRIPGSIQVIHEQLAAGHPLLLLIEDRPSKYHYVVAVGADDTGVLVHDPTWGPARRMANSHFQRVWRPTGFWALIVTPGNALSPRPAAPRTLDVKAPERGEPTACDRLLDEALDSIELRGLSVGDDELGRVREQCPGASGPIRELAGIRFGQERWRDAAVLAEEALDRDADDAYAWDLLGSSRFLLNDSRGALRAWNQIGKPTLDSVQIEGLRHTRYALVAEVAGLKPHTLLTDRQLTLAERRLQQLPDRVATRVGYRQDADGFATVDVTIRERSPRPRGLVEWTTLGGQALINREVNLAIPGRTGQGEVWSGSWRWWAERPRVGLSFSAPHLGSPGGIWRVDAFWEGETYALGGPAARVREERAHGGLSIGNWLTPNVRYEVSAGLDQWDGRDRTISVGAGIDRRFLADRVSTTASTTFWRPIGSQPSFSVVSVGGAFRSRADAQGFVAVAHVRGDAASSAAPLSLWSGAGEGRARPGLLRAHALLHRGVIEGPVFGRQTASANLELQRWWTRPVFPRVGAAAFADLAGASQRLSSSSGKPVQVDIGAGLRVRVPSSDGTLRLDYGRGLRDGADRFTIAWTSQ